MGHGLASAVDSCCFVDRLLELSSQTAKYKSRNVVETVGSFVHATKLLLVKLMFCAIISVIAGWLLHRMAEVLSYQSEWPIVWLMMATWLMNEDAGNDAQYCVR